MQGGNENLYPPSTTPATFVITGLPAGKWTAYPGYCTEFGCSTNPNAGRPVTTVAGKSSDIALSTPYLVPPNGQLTATVAVTGAPAGFNDPVGVMACQVTTYGSSCEGSSGSNGPFTSILGDGVWAVTGFYTVAPFGNMVSGPVQFIDIQGGQTTTLALTVPYQVLGTATGTIRITGKPANVHPTSYSVSACPVGIGLSNPFSFLSCVYEYSGSGSYSYGAAAPKRIGKNASRGTLHKSAGVKINTFDLPTLTPGLWDIQVSYSTAFGSFYSQNDTIVNVTPGGTTNVKVKVPYQVPTFGIVKGSLNLVNVPGNFNPGVEACDTPPVGGSCSGEVDASLDGNGGYQLSLAPGTWWIQGVTYVYSGFTTETLTSPPKQVTVAAGTQTKANLTVTGP